MTKKQILNEVIKGYRKVVHNRYQYTSLSERYELPSFLNEERIDLFRIYFLDYIYPPPTKRIELDEAFESLDNYIKHPSKLLRILVDSSRLIFKYGRHLPKILRAGLKALHSFRTANTFEEKLVNQAIRMNLAAPYKKTAINALIKSLPKADLENFIESSQSLFATLHDRILVKKIIEIVDYLIDKMKQRPSVYSAVEVRGLEISQEIIIHGDALFDQLPAEDQQQLFEFVIRLEREVLKELFVE